MEDILKIICNKGLIYNKWIHKHNLTSNKKGQLVFSGIQIKNTMKYPAE